MDAREALNKNEPKTMEIVEDAPVTTTK